MSLFKRALLYVTRKKGKTALMFTILFVMATFVLAGLSIKKGTDIAADSLRESLGGNFTLKPKMDMSNFQMSGGGMVYGGKHLKDEDIAKVLSVEGIKAFNGMDLCYMSPLNAKLIPSSWPEPNPEWGQFTTLFSNSYTELSRNFTTGTFELSEGRHLTPDDVSKCLISEELAALNDFAAGDSIRLEIGDWMAQNSGDIARESVELEIAGIFKIKTKTPPGPLTIENDLPENFILCDNETVRFVEDLYSPTPDKIYADGVTFFVSDAKELEQVMNKVKALPNIDWDSFQVTVDDQVYQASAQPIENLGSLITTLIVIIIIVAVALLTLILTMWIKSRVHEMGILLSVGVGKVNIIGQYVTECVLIAVMAFSLSYFTSAYVAKTAGDVFLKQMIAEQTEENERYSARTPQNGQNFNSAEGEINLLVSTPDEIDINVGVMEMVIVMLTGLGIIFAAVSVSSITVIRLKPKDILSKMS
jgi:putative ABC transport system permease protein